LEDESGDLELGALVAAGEQRSGLRRVVRAEELGIELGGGAIGERIDRRSTREAERERGRAREGGVAWEDCGDK